jgi:hypothetical protein
MARAQNGYRVCFAVVCYRWTLAVSGPANICSTPIAKVQNYDGVGFGLAKGKAKAHFAFNLRNKLIFQWTGLP